MFLIGVAVLCALSTVYAGWLQELTLGRGLELGSGFSLHLDRLKRENVSLLERHALRVDYSGVGLSVEKALNRDALQLRLYVGDEAEGRKRKVGEVSVPVIIGFKATGIAILTFTAVTLLVFKALGIAKLAVLVSAGMMIAKFLHRDRESTSHVEFEELPLHQHPLFAEYPSATGYSPSGSANYYSYANYGATGAEAETAAQYAMVGAATGNSSVAAVAAGKRHDFLRGKSQTVPFPTVRKYTIRH